MDFIDDIFDLPPDAAIITGPVGCGKTQAALDAIIDARRMGSAFNTIWVVLATNEQIHAFRERLVDHSEDHVQFGVEFYNFHQLYARLLELAGNPQRQIEGTARYRILHHVATGLQARGELELFGQIASLPGFIGQIAGLVHELKQALVFPEEFAAAAQSRGPKDRDLARIYSGYQTLLREKHLVDRHGAGWLALEYLESVERLPLTLDLLVIDGFDQFSTIHARLLTALARHARQTILTLTRAEDEQQGRRFRRFDQTRRRVLAAGGELWREQALEHCDANARVPILDHLVHSVFHSAAPAQSPDEDRPSLSLIEAPDVRREVSAVLWRTKRLLLDGAPAESIAILARRLDLYSGALRETAEAYGVPLVVREDVPLRENPAVAALLALIDLHEGDFRRRDLLDVLFSPYIVAPFLSPDQVAQLARISVERRIVRGRDTWLDTLRAFGGPLPDEDGELPDQDGPSHPAALAEALAQFMDRVTPPARGTITELTAWIEQLIGPDPEAAAEDAAHLVETDAAPPPDHAHLLEQVRATADGERAARDIAALGEFMRILSGLRGAYDLLAADGRLEPLAWAEFRAELALAVDQATVVPPGGRSRLGRVLATDVLEARGLPHDHVFLLGLAEGVFPCPESQDAFFSDRERRALAAAGLDVQTAAERADDASLFYQAIGLARRTLTLSRFTIDDKGTPCPPSPFWTAARAAVDVPPSAIERLPVGGAPSLSQAATLDEVAVATAAILSGEQPDGIPAAAQAYNALLATGPWRAVLRGRSIEARREDRTAAFDPYTGVLSDPALIEYVAKQLGPDRVWSATQFNDYGICAFRFFAGRLLGLEELVEPEEGLDARQLGSVYHAILERTYRQIAVEDLEFAPDNAGRAVAILNMVAAEVLATAPESFAFRPGPVWQHEQANMLRRLTWLVRQDFESTGPFNPKAHKPILKLGASGRRRALVHEASFGFGDQPPLAIDGPAGTLRVRGKIDRIDVTGERAFVIDYKTGATRRSESDMAAGIDFQMLIYLLAAQHVVAQIDASLSVAGGVFWHITNRKTSGEVAAGAGEIEQAREYLHAHVLAAREGQFPVQPRKMDGGKCVSFCEFRPLCRLSRAYRHKSSAGVGELPASKG